MAIMVFGIDFTFNKLRKENIIIIKPAIYTSFLQIWSKHANYSKIL